MVGGPSSAEYNTEPSYMNECVIVIDVLTGEANYDLIVHEERKMDIETMVSNAMKAAKVIKL